MQQGLGRCHFEPNHGRSLEVLRAGRPLHSQLQGATTPLPTRTLALKETAVFNTLSVEFLVWTREAAACLSISRCGFASLQAGSVAGELQAVVLGVTLLLGLGGFPSPNSVQIRVLVFFFMTLCLLACPKGKMAVTRDPKSSLVFPPGGCRCHRCIEIPLPCPRGRWSF